MSQETYYKTNCLILIEVLMFTMSSVPLPGSDRLTLEPLGVWVCPAAPLPSHSLHPRHLPQHPRQNQMCHYYGMDQHHSEKCGQIQI